MTQKLIDFDRPESLKPQSKRLNRQCREILARLEQGPATNSELVQIAQRFGARIQELRVAGCEIEVTKLDTKRGINQYTLTKGIDPEARHA